MINSLGGCGLAAESVEARLARLEGSYEQINERLGHLGSELAETRREILARMDRQFYWLIGVLFISLASFTTSLLVLLNHDEASWISQKEAGIGYPASFTARISALCVHLLNVIDRLCRCVPSRGCAFPDWHWSRQCHLHNHLRAQSSLQISSP